VSTDHLDRIARWIAEADRVVALTGAGISTESGIPDFRGPQGLWTRDPTAERRATIQAWIEDAELRREAWQFRAAHRDVAFTPNDAHRALTALQDLGRLDLVVTQNIDGLHQQAGTDPSRVIEVHGSARDVVCLDCGRRQPAADVLDRVAAGEVDPRCRACGGLLKSATISFGQSLVDEDLARAREAVTSADLLLTLGTTLTVYPIAWLPLMARRAGARVVILNGEPTEMDDLANLSLVTRLGEVLPSLVDRVRAHLG
jgi:NAD-dependent deacetylase